MQKKWISKALLLSAISLIAASPARAVDVVSCPDCVMAIGQNMAEVAAQGGNIASEVSSSGRSVVDAVNRNTKSTKNQLSSDTDRLIAALSQTGDSINDHMTDIYEQRKIFDAQKSPTICARQDGMARLALNESVAADVQRARSKFSAQRSKSTDRAAEEQLQRANAHMKYFCSEKEEKEYGLCKAVDPKLQNLDIDAGRAMNPDDGVLDEKEALAARLLFQRVTNPFPAPSLPKGFKQDTARAKAFRELSDIYASQISTASQSLNNKISELEPPVPDGETSVNMELENAVNSLVAPANLQNNKQTSMMSGDISDISQMTGLQTKITWMMYKEMQRQGQVLGAMQMILTEEFIKPRLDEARRAASIDASN